MSQVSNEGDLSTTLIERRKRLHVLATEINKWEDESNKKYLFKKKFKKFINNIYFFYKQKKSNNPTIPIAPPIPQDFNRTSNL